MNVIFAYNINSSTCPTSSIPPPLPPDPRSSTPPQVHLHPLQHHHRRLNITVNITATIPVTVTITMIALTHIASMIM